MRAVGFRYRGQLALAALVVAILAAFAGPALAQGEPPTAVVQGGSAAPRAGSGTRIELTPGRKVMVPVRGEGSGGVGTAPADVGSSAPYRPKDNGDVRTGTGKSSAPMALAFWLFALVTVGGAIFVITRKNLIAAVMGMVGSFFGVAATYMMLYASFLAVVQMLVYAGAIMVLFVFVIMILNKPEDEPWHGGVGLFGKGIAGLGMAYLGFRLVTLVWHVVPLPTSADAPSAVKVMVGKVADSYAWGGTKAVGNTLFNGYLFPFEAVSILLLVAVVGAIAVARPLKDDDGLTPPEGMP